MTYEVMKWWFWWRIPVQKVWRFIKKCVILSHKLPPYQQGTGLLHHHFFAKKVRIWKGGKKILLIIIANHHQTFFYRLGVQIYYKTRQYHKLIITIKKIQKKIIKKYFMYLSSFVLSLTFQECFKCISFHLL